MLPKLCKQQVPRASTILMIGKRFFHDNQVNQRSISLAACNAEIAQEHNFNVRFNSPKFDFYDWDSSTPNGSSLKLQEKMKNEKDILNDDWVCGQYDNAISKISNIQNELLSHSMYSNLTDIESLKILMNSHVFQVWDFMFLVKKMQYILQNNYNVASDMPWMPPMNNQLIRFIQEIMLCEETDSFDKLHAITGKESMSHLEMYLMGMNNIGLNTNYINNIMNKFSKLQWNNFNIIDNNMNEMNNILYKYKNEFTTNACLDMFEWNLNLSLKCNNINNLHLLSAAFIFGRENIIPPMFEQVIKFIPQTDETKVFWLYLERHIEVDGGSDDSECDQDSHQILGQKLLKLLCGYDELKWKQCLDIGIKSLQLRCNVWDQVLQQIKLSRKKK